MTEPPTWARLPTSIVIYPDPTRNLWRHTQSGPRGILDGHLGLPSTASASEARQAAESMLAEIGITYHDADITIVWHAADDRGWIIGDVNSHPRSPKST